MKKKEEIIKRLQSALALLKEEYKDWNKTKLSAVARKTLGLDSAQARAIIDQKIIIAYHPDGPNKRAQLYKWNQDLVVQDFVKLANVVYHAAAKTRRKRAAKRLTNKPVTLTGKASYKLQDKKLYKIPELPTNKALDDIYAKFETHTTCKCECHFNEVFEDRIYGRIKDVKWYPMSWDMKGEPSNGNALHKLIVKDPVLSELRAIQNQLTEQLKKVSDEIKQRTNN